MLVCVANKNFGEDKPASQRILNLKDFPERNFLNDDVEHFWRDDDSVCVVRSTATAGSRMTPVRRRVFGGICWTLLWNLLDAPAGADFGGNWDGIYVRIMTWIVGCVGLFVLCGSRYEADHSDIQQFLPKTLFFTFSYLFVTSLCRAKHRRPKGAGHQVSEEDFTES
jgi:hypothetical protein